MVQSNETNLLKNLFQTQDELSTLSPIDNLDQIDRQFLLNYISFIQQHPELIFIFSLQGELLTNNLHILNKKLSLQADEQINYRDYIPQEDYRVLLSAFNNIKNGKSSYEQIEFSMVTKENDQLFFLGTFLPIKSHTNNTIAVSLIMQDKTDMIKLEMALQQTNEEYKYIFDHIQSGTWIYDVKKNKINFASKGLSVILQVPLNDLYEKPTFLEDLILPQYLKQFQAKNDLLYKGKPVDRTFQIKTGRNIVKWIHEQTIPTISPTGEVTHFFGRLIDITKEMVMKRKLEYLAKHDSITNLPNHHSLQEKLDEYINNERIEQFALLSINLDNFQWIIDYLGFKIGDQVIKMIAKRLNELRPDNAFLAKESNDSFVYILANYTDDEEVIHFVEDMMNRVADKLNVEGYEFYITTSIGISFYPKHGTDKLILLENAHSALHYAKRIGKNNFQIYSSDRDISAHKKYTLERDLRKALENNEFELHYQPQVDAKTKEMVGAEALIRWNHREWGIVSPAEFIPIAEKKHLINEIGDWVLETACKHLDTWRGQGKKLIPISINVSPIQLLKPGILDTIKEILNKYNIPAEYIVVEITEGALLQKEDYILKTLTDIKKLGIKIALDDFGTGYSTFQYLQTFDLDILKIDKSFVQNIYSKDEKETTEIAIVSSFLHFAKSTGLKVVAEGVEELEQLEYLMEKNCDVIQGYLFSKPVPVDEFELLINRKFLTPVDPESVTKPLEERRKYVRFKFPYHLPMKVYVTKIGSKKVHVGHATGLIEDIGLGGIRFISNIRLPVISELNFKFEFEIMGEKFNLIGSLVYKNDEKHDIFSYGVKFQMSDDETERLAKIINQMTLLRKLNRKIPDTKFIKESPTNYLLNH